jgi:hypothetical protein
MFSSLYQLHLILLFALVSDATPSIPAKFLLRKYADQRRSAFPAIILPKPVTPAPFSDIGAGAGAGARGSSGAQGASGARGSNGASGYRPGESESEPEGTFGSSGLSGHTDGPTVADPYTTQTGNPFSSTTAKEWIEKILDVADLLQSFFGDLPDPTKLGTGNACSSCSSFSNSSCPAPKLNTTQAQTYSGSSFTWTAILNVINDNCNTTDIGRALATNGSSTPVIETCHTALKQSYANWYYQTNSYCAPASSGTPPTGMVANAAGRLDMAGTFILVSAMLSVFAFLA